MTSAWPIIQDTAPPHYVRGSRLRLRLAPAPRRRTRLAAWGAAQFAPIWCLIKVSNNGAVFGLESEGSTAYHQVI